MAISSADLIAPVGLVEASLFPGEASNVMAERLDGYLDEGYTRATAAEADEANHDEAAKQWAYHRAFLQVYLRLSANPSQVDVDGKGSHQYLISQINNFKNLSDDALRAHQGLLVPVTVKRTTQTRPSHTVRNSFSW